MTDKTLLEMASDLRDTSAQFAIALDDFAKSLDAQQKRADERHAAFLKACDDLTEAAKQAAA